MDISVYDDDRLVWCIQVKEKARSLDSLLTGSTSAWRTTATGSCWSTISCPSDEKARPGGAAALTPDVVVKTCNPNLWERRCTDGPTCAAPER